MPQSYKQFLAASAKRRARVMAMYAAKVSQAAIGRKLKISQQRVARIIAKEKAKRA
jgi:DNA-binding transcriptional regulator LsrR (DeoR family)